MRIPHFLPALALCVAAASIVPRAQSPTPSWDQWRGPRRDGVASFDAPSAWPERLTKRWEQTVGLGHASPVISGDRVIIHTRQGEREVVQALDLQTGEQSWQDAYPAPYQMNSAARGHGPGPKSTPLVADGRVFTFGISGILSAYDVRTGKQLWRVGSPAVLPDFGTAMSPISDGTHVIAHVGGVDKGALTAFDAASGKDVWRWAGDGPGYASPVIAEISGTRHVITQTQRALVGIDVRDGRLLWQVPFRTSYDQNSITPVVIGDLVIYSGLDQGTMARRVVRSGAGWTTEPVWKNDQISMYMSTPVAAERVVFGLAHRNSGQFFALDAATGKTLWTTKGREGENASILRAGSLLLLFTTNAELVVARANPSAYEEVRRYTVADTAMWAHPAVAGRQMVIKDLEKLVLWSL